MLAVIVTEVISQLFRVNPKAIIHGVKNEGKAIRAYNIVLSENHKDFALRRCGIFIPGCMLHLISSLLAAVVEMDVEKLSAFRP